MDFEAEIRRRVTLLEEDAKGEKTVSRHILRKVNQMHDDLLGLRDEVIGVKKDVSSLREELVLLRADLPSIIANVVGALLREERERK
jgi:uncharacterized protein YoxC